jgi:hypothetical protein
MIGIVRVSRWSAVVAGVPSEKITSGCRPTNSFANIGIQSTLPVAQRTSIRTRPSVQPNSVSPCVNPERRAFPSGSLSPYAISTPMRRMRSPCCACATIGHAAALPSPAMNCRRLIESLHRPWPTAFPGW